MSEISLYIYFKVWELYLQVPLRTMHITHALTKIYINIWCILYMVHKAVCRMLKVIFVPLYFVSFVLSLIVHHTFSFWCIGKAMIHDCTIFWAFTYIFRSDNMCIFLTNIHTLPLNRKVISFRKSNPVTTVFAFFLDGVTSIGSAPPKSKVFPLRIDCYSNAGSVLSAFQKFSAWLSMCLVEHIMVLVVVFLCFSFTQLLSFFICFMTLFLIIFISLRCFTDDAEIRYATGHIIVIWISFTIHGDFSRVLNWFKPSHSPLPRVTFQLVVPRRLLYCSSSSFVRRYSHVWPLFCYCFLLL